MRIRPWMQRWLAVAVLTTLLVTAMAACGGGAAPAAETVADGATLLEERCTECHGLERTTSESKTRDEWLETVDRMIQKGAELNAEEKEVLVDYLAETYGP